VIYHRPQPVRSALSPLAVAVLVWAGVAVSPAAAGAQDNSDKARAARLLDQGVAAFDAGDHTQALARFQEAYAAYASPKILLNIGEAHRKLGHRAKAMQAFDSFLSETASLPEVGDARVSAARKAIAELRPTVGRIVPDVTPPEANVTLDGEAAGSAATIRTLYVEPGEHEIAASAPEHEPARAQVRVGANQEKRVELVLTAAPVVAAGVPDAAPAPAAAPSRLPFWIAAGAGAALFAAAGGVALHANGLYSDLKDASQGGSHPDAARWDELSPKVHDEQLAVNVLLAAGGAAAITAGILFYLSRPASEPAVSVAPVALDGPGMTAVIRF